MTDAVIVSTARTALAKSWRGGFNMTHGATLGGHVVRAAIARAGIEAGELEDVLMGCANPEGATACRPLRWPRNASSPAKATLMPPAASSRSPACRMK